MASNKDSKNGTTETKPAVVPETKPAIVETPTVPPVAPPPSPMPIDPKKEMTIQDRLSDPFDPSWLRAKPQVVKPGRALAVTFITARDVQHRLDDVVGVENWQDEYTILQYAGAGKDLVVQVKCKLSICINGKWVAKEDVGSEGDVGDDGDKLKGAFSDALKRAAVKFGIGRYLYFLPPMWCDYDNEKREFTSWPELPVWAYPKGTEPVKSPAIGAAGGIANAEAQPKDEIPKPKDGKELRARLIEYEKKNGKVFKTGQLLSWVAAVCSWAGYKQPMDQWKEEECDFVAKLAGAMKQAVEKGKSLPRDQEIADPLAEALQKEIEQQGRDHFGRGWGLWLAEQGCPDEKEMSRYHFAALKALQRAMTSQIAEERKEREAIQADSTKKG